MSRQLPPKLLRPLPERLAPPGHARGVSLVEVLVALAVVAINLLAWQAALQLVVALLRHMGAVEAQAGDGAAFAAVCLALVPRPRPSPSWALPSSVVQHAPPGARRARRRRAGLTLVEVLVALAIGTALLGLVAASFGAARRSTVAALHVSEAITVRLALPSLLHDAIGAAGRGLDPSSHAACGLGVADGGRRLVLRWVEGAEPVEEHVFAARDGAGRPALYLRRPPHPRQPWIEDVTGFSVVSIDDAAAAWVRAVHVDLDHRALEAPLRVAVALTHHPCIAQGEP